MHARCDASAAMLWQENRGGAAPSVRAGLAIAREARALTREHCNLSRYRRPVLAICTIGICLKC